MLGKMLAIKRPNSCFSLSRCCKLTNYINGHSKKLPQVNDRFFQSKVACSRQKVPAEDTSGANGSPNVRRLENALRN
jgi:hypothetical protein